MKRAFRLICSPRRQVLLRQGIPIVLIYGLLLPHLMGFLAMEDPTMTAREIFRSSQLVLAFLTLWPLFCFFLPVYQPGTREVLQALRHPVVSCVLELTTVGQAICIPLYVWLFVTVPDYPVIVWILAFQGLCLSMAFACLLCLFHSPVGTMCGGLLYICISIPLVDARIPMLLLRPGRLMDGFGMRYWVVHVLIQGVIVLYLVWYDHFYRASRFS